MNKRKNILLITSDQHRWDCYGFEGRRIQTPNLDRLAASGTRFSAAITPNVVCQPSRASILTGLLPLTHGVGDNEVSLDPSVAEKGWARTLAKNGYQSAFIGKAHFGTDPHATPFGAPESREESANFPVDWNGPYMGFDYVELMILGHWHKYLPCERPPRGQHFERFFWSRGDYEGEAWDLWEQNIGRQPEGAQTWFSKLPPLWHSTTWVTDRTNEFLRAHDRSKPFCLWASFPDPHHPFDCPLPWSRLHSPEDVDISRFHKRDLERRPWWHRASLENEPAVTAAWQKITRTTYSRMQPQTDRQLADITSNYYGMISFIDHGVGQILQTLEDQNLLEDTIVVFTSDHGELLGDHGLYLKGPTPYEGLLRVGMIVSGPDVAQGKIVREPVSTMDLAPSFLEWGNAGAESELQGRSLVGLTNGASESRDVAYSEWKLHPRRAGVELDLRTVRTKSAKLTIDLISGVGEMYDLANDPDEMVELFGDAGYAALRRELTDMIHARPGKIF